MSDARHLTPPERLRLARIKRRWRSAAAFAAAHDLVESAYRSHENGTRGMSIETIKRYAALLHIDWTWIADGHGLGPDDDTVQAPAHDLPKTLFVIGAIQTDSWRPGIIWPQSSWQDTGIPPSPRFPHAHHVAMELRDDSLDVLYPSGSIIEFIHLEQAGALVNGDLVIVIRRRADDMQECTVREFRRDPRGRAWLWQRSLQPEFQQPLGLSETAATYVAQVIPDTAAEIVVYGLIIAEHPPKS